MSWCSTKAFPRRVSEISPPKLLLFTWDFKKHAGVTWHRLIIEMLRAGRARVTGVPWRSSKEMRCRFKPRTSRKLVQMDWNCHVSCEFIVKETYRRSCWQVTLPVYYFVSSSLTCLIPVGEDAMTGETEKYLRPQDLRELGDDSLPQEGYMGFSIGARSAR